MFITFEETKSMTDEEAMKAGDVDTMNTINSEWTAYNNLNNEGGEGFNPHDKHITAGDGEPLWSILDDKQYRLERILTGTSNDSPRYDELAKEIAELKAAVEIAKKEGI